MNGMARIGSLVVAGIFILGCFGTADVRAAALSWDGSAGDGLAATAANWTPSGVPAAADDLTFNLAGVFPLTWGATVTSSHMHVYRTGTITNTMSSPHTVSNGITIGDTAALSATMTLTTGTLTSNASVVLGSAVNSTGTLNVNDDDADFIVAGAASDLTVGLNGDAAMNITGRGYVQVGDQFIAGANSGSSPSISISGSLAVPPFGVSHLEVLGTGQSRIGAGGDVTMFVSSGALAEFAGDLVIANGSASVSSVTVQTAGLLNARLLVDGDLQVARNAVLANGVLAGNGTLTINTGGTTTVGGDTYLGDPDGGTGTISMGGGIFEGDAAVNMETGSAITGFGTVNADVNVGPGSIVPTTAAGITMEGIINCTTAGVFGTKIHFGATGGYTGSGSCATDITGDAAAVITATGSLSLGKNTTSGFSYNGILDVGGNIVTLVDSNQAVLGGLVTINSGRVECSTGVGIQNGATFQGDGLIVGDVVNSGMIDPHMPNALGGLITIQGDLHMNPTGKFDMELGGTPGGNNNDRMNVANTATFDGTMRVKLKNGFIPHVGQQFIAINAVQGRIGEFDNIELDASAANVCNEVTFVLVYSNTAAIVLVRPPLGCTALGDLNSNGGCDGNDIKLFMDALLNGPYDSCADMDGDCTNDMDDVPIFVNCLI